MNPITQIRKYRWIVTGRWKIKQQIKSASDIGKVKIIIGSGSTQYDGWIATDLPHFNILKENDWNCFFSVHKVDNFLAEHVLEHLSEREVEKVLQFAYSYLKKGGYFRIAVPDGNNPDPKYIDDVSPFGKIGSYHGHKSLWNYKTFSELAKKNKFEIKILEYFNEKGNYILNSFTDGNGWISRTGKNQNTEKSLIVDLIKT